MVGINDPHLIILNLKPDLVSQYSNVKKIKVFYDVPMAYSLELGSVYIAYPVSGAEVALNDPLTRMSTSNDGMFHVTDIQVQTTTSTWHSIKKKVTTGKAYIKKNFNNYNITIMEE